MFRTAFRPSMTVSMAQRRNSFLPIALLVLLLGGGLYFFLDRSPDGDRKNTGTDSAVTSSSSSSADPAAADDMPSGAPTDGIQGIFFSNAYANDPSVGQKDEKNVDRQLAAVIAAAHGTIDCALFELESERIADALIQAHERGVAVRMVAETDYADNQDLQRVLKAGIPVVQDKRSALMHNKFIVIDSSLVWTGSLNVTDNGAWRNNNNALLIRSRELAENYGFEFEEMFVRREFGPRSTSNTPHTLVKFPDADIYNYFAPEDDVLSKVIRYLKSAKSRIRFMAFSMTEDAVGDMLIEKDKEGVDVAGVLESRGSGSIYSELGRLTAAGIPVLTDGNKYVMHHKVIIIDGLWTITGSYNFSASAQTSNDENILIIKSAAVARMFEEEYERVRQMAQAGA